MIPQKTKFYIEFLLVFSLLLCRSAKKRLVEEARTKRTNRMLIAMVVIFGVCWFPIDLINILADSLPLGQGEHVWWEIGKYRTF